MLTDLLQKLYSVLPLSWFEVNSTSVFKAIKTLRHTATLCFCAWDVKFFYFLVLIWISWKGKQFVGHRSQTRYLTKLNPNNDNFLCQSLCRNQLLSSPSPVLTSLLHSNISIFAPLLNPLHPALLCVSSPGMSRLSSLSLWHFTLDDIIHTDTYFIRLAFCLHDLKRSLHLDWPFLGVYTAKKKHLVFLKCVSWIW